MGRTRRRVKKLADRNALRPGEKEIADRGREIAEQLAITVGRTAGLYAELVPDGRELTPREAAAAREQLEAVAICLRDIHHDRDIIDRFAEEGRRIGRDADMRPTISVLRMMQRSLALALSEDPARRAHVMPIDELRKFVVPVHRFWRDI
jgi:hypothetical protein